MISQRCLSVPLVAILKKWFTFSEWLHLAEQPGIARPQTKTKAQHLHPPKHEVHPSIPCCHLAMLKSNVIQVIQLVVGLKSAVGSPDTKSFDISFRNKIYLCKKCIAVLKMIP